MKRTTFHLRTANRSIWFWGILILLSFSFTGELFSQGVSTLTLREDDPLLSEKTGFVRAVARANPSVVSIQGEKQAEGSESYETSNRGKSGRETVTHIGMGTGIIVDERGYIITNYHVVKGLTKIQITTSDGAIYRDVEFIRNDLTTDLALLKIKPVNKLQKIAFGRSENVFLAEDVIAIGNPFGYQASVSRGIVSGLNRPLKASETLFYENVIQTDAAINPGNSGGPLVNIKGEMIGLNAAVREGAENIAFAIPVDIVIEVADRMIRESVTGIQNTGISLRQVDLEEQGKKHGSVARCIVQNLEETSPAARSGLRKGDFLLVSNKNDIHSPLDFTCSLIDHPRENPIKVIVSRNGHQLELSLQLDEQKNVGIQFHAARPASAESETRTVYAQKTTAESNEIILTANNKEEYLWSKFGIQIEPVSQEKYRELYPDLQSITMGRYKIHPTGGVRVTAVSDTSLFKTKNERLEKGDVIFGFVIGQSDENRWCVTSLDDCCYIADAWERLPQKEENQKARIYLIRKNTAYFFDIVH